MLQKFHSFHNKSIGLLFVRIALGVVFIAHGWSKISAMEGTISFFNSQGFSSFWAYLVAWVEFLGGIAVLLGFLTPYVGIAFAIIMLVAILKVKTGKPFMGQGGWEFDFVLLLASLSLIFSRAGKYAVPCVTNRNKCNCSSGCNCEVGKCNCPENHK